MQRRRTAWHMCSTECLRRRGAAARALHPGKLVRGQQHRIFDLHEAPARNEDQGRSCGGEGPRHEMPVRRPACDRRASVMAKRKSCEETEPQHSVEKEHRQRAKPVEIACVEVARAQPVDHQIGERTADQERKRSKRERRTSAQASRPSRQDRSEPHNVADGDNRHLRHRAGNRRQHVPPEIRHRPLVEPALVGDEEAQTRTSRSRHERRGPAAAARPTRTPSAPLLESPHGKRQWPPQGTEALVRSKSPSCLRTSPSQGPPKTCAPTVGKRERTARKCPASASRHRTEPCAHVPCPWHPSDPAGRKSDQQGRKGQDEASRLNKRRGHLHHVGESRAQEGVSSPVKPAPDCTL